MALEIVKNADGEKLNVSLTGRLDTNTAPQFEQELGLDGFNDVVLDFSGLEYISSAGLRVVLSAQKKMNGKGSLKLCNVNETIMEVFEITGFTDILTIE